MCGWWLCRSLFTHLHEGCLRQIGCAMSVQTPELGFCNFPSLVSVGSGRYLLCLQRQLQLARRWCTNGSLLHIPQDDELQAC